jgi:hypothetical protein
MNKKYMNVTPIMTVKPSYIHIPLTSEEAPIGTMVYAILRGGKEDGQIIEGEIQGYNNKRIIVMYNLRGDFPTIESMSEKDVSKDRKELVEMQENLEREAWRN